MCIKESNLLSSLSTDQITCVRNLVGTQWLTDVSVVYMANLINSTTSSALCMVVQHPTFMFSNELLARKALVKLRLHLKVVMVDAIGLFYFFMLIPPHAWYYGILWLGKYHQICIG